MNPSSVPVRSTLAVVLASVLVTGAPAARAQKPPERRAASPARPVKRKMPPEATLKEMVRKTLLDMDKGLETKDFTQLYATLAPTTRKNFTKEQVAALYAGQIAQEQRTDYAATTDAVFDPAPSIDDRGVLTLSGHIPSEPQWVVFRLKYLDEGGWKPYAMTVRVQNSSYAPNRLPEPGEKELPPGKPRDPNAPPVPAPTPTVAVTPGPPAYVSPFGSGSPAASPAPAAAGSPSPSPAASPK